MTATVGFIGLDVFGSRLAARLRREDFGLLVHDSWIEPVRYFMLKNSADIGESPRMLAALCDVVVCVLPDAASVRKAALGPLGLADGLRDGRQCILLDLGTSSAAEAIALAADVAPKGIHYVEAPARGSPMDARDGKLSIPVGGAPDDIERAMPVLRALSQKVEHTGAVGSAHLISTFVEQVRASTMLALAETLAVAQANGVSGAALRAWCEQEGLLSASMQKLFADRAISSGETLETLMHNLGLLGELAHERGLQPKVAMLTRQLWSEAAKALGPQQDVTEIGKWMAQAIAVPSSDSRKEGDVADVTESPDSRA